VQSSHDLPSEAEFDLLAETDASSIATLSAQFASYYHRERVEQNWDRDPRSVVLKLLEHEDELSDRIASLPVIAWLWSNRDWHRACQAAFTASSRLTRAELADSWLAWINRRKEAADRTFPNSPWLRSTAHYTHEMAHRIARFRQWVVSVGICIGRYYYGAPFAIRSRDRKLVKELLDTLDRAASMVAECDARGFFSGDWGGRVRPLAIATTRYRLEMLAEADRSGVLYKALRDDESAGLRNFVREVAVANFRVKRGGAPKSISALLCLPGFPSNPLDHRTVERLVADERLRLRRCNDITRPKG
jgi:hypothetical protein